MQRFFCYGIRRAGVTTIAYIEDGHVVIKTMPPTPKAPPRPLMERADGHA